MIYIGHCKHGEFDLHKGCPECIADRMAKEGNTEASIAEAVKTANEKQRPIIITEAQLLEIAAVTTIALRPGEDIEAQIEVVILARENAQRAKDSKSVAYSAWEREYKSLLDSVTVTSELVAEEEAKLRALTLQAYEQTGNKAPAPGVSIKIFQMLDYDPKEALKWAMAHQIALSLDKKSFETFAKATPLEFVTIKEEPRAQIAQNLT